MSAFDGTISVATQKRKEQEVVTDKLASKTFAVWASHQLSQKGYPKLDDMVESIRDGVSLIYLVESLFDVKVSQKYSPNPSTEIQKIENIAIALELFKAHGVSININSKDICDGNRKLILGFVWRLIMQHQMLRPGEVSADKSKQAKENLLKYVRKQVENYNLSVQDFTSSFYDGSVFCALVHSMDSELIDWSHVLEDTPKNNLEKAFSAAEKLGIPRMLDVEDMSNPQLSLRPDEKCIMTYISEFPVAFVECLKKREIKVKEDAEIQKKKREEEMQKQAEQRQRIIEEQQTILKKTQSTEDLLRTSVDMERKKLEEELEKLKKENEKLQNDLSVTKNKLIGKLTVLVKEARDLMEMNRIFGKSDPFVTLKMENQQYKTTVKKRTLTPKWEQEFDFFVTDRRSELDICIWDWDKFSSDEFMGKASVRVADLQDGYNQSQWYKLQPLKEGEKVAGEILLHLVFSYGAV